MENEKLALRGESQTQHQILLFKLCVGVCRLIVEERGQVPDNWIQLCQTEYLIPFGRRLRGRSCGNYTILTLPELFLIIFSHLQLLLIEPYLRVERILNPRVCHLCKKRMDDWGAGRREWLWEWLEAENVFIHGCQMFWNWVGSTWTPPSTCRKNWPYHLLLSERMEERKWKFYSFYWF